MMKQGRPSRHWLHQQSKKTRAQVPLSRVGEGEERRDLPNSVVVMDPRLRGDDGEVLVPFGQSSHHRVMPALVAAIHAFFGTAFLKTWVAATSAAMTVEGVSSSAPAH
jgi:ribosome biogenesis protein Tsr3